MKTTMKKTSTQRMMSAAKIAAATLVTTPKVAPQVRLRMPWTHMVTQTGSVCLPGIDSISDFR